MNQVLYWAWGYKVIRKLIRPLCSDRVYSPVTIKIHKFKLYLQQVPQRRGKTALRAYKLGVRGGEEWSRVET